MGLVVIALLAGLWAAILLPDALRERRLSSPLDSVEFFERSMSMLAPARTAPGRYVMILHEPAVIARASRRSSVLRRRRAWLSRLAAAVPVSVVLAAVIGGAAWALVGLSVGALSAYVAILVTIRSREIQARAKVRPIRRPEAASPPSALPPAHPRGA